MGILFVKWQVLIWILIKWGNETEKWHRCLQNSDLIRYLNTIFFFDILSNQFSIKCLLLERKMKKFDIAKRGLSRINNI